MIEIDTEIRRHATPTDVDIDVTGIDMGKLVKHAYDLSRPQGAGVLRYKPGPLDLVQVEDILRLPRRAPGVELQIDYLWGRSMKLLVKRRGDRLFVRSTWLDHSQFELVELLYRCGFNPWHF